MWSLIVLRHRIRILAMTVYHLLLTNQHKATRKSCMLFGIMYLMYIRINSPEATNTKLGDHQNMFGDCRLQLLLETANSNVATL
jgi:hypothetical protein